MGLISLSEFCRTHHATHHEHGLSIDANIPKLLEEIHTIVRHLAKGNLAIFHLHERSLYQPIKEVLEYNLPARNLVTIENSLHRTAFPSQRTDIAIRALGHTQSSRLSRDLECSHFIEIKSVFSGETLSLTSIEEDLAKLLRCEESYSAICFFVLTGLEAELMKHHRIVSFLGLKGDEQVPLELETVAGHTYWLTRAGSVLTTNPLVYIWRVTRQCPHNGLGPSGCTYSVFQHR